jgi:non-ribosomal peptide synthase protein (TIGR01720 family)
VGEERSRGADDIIQVQFTEAETQAIGKVSRLQNAQIAEVLLTGLAMGYERWIGVRSMLVAIERHGREELEDEVDLSRTVGWFTAISPLLLNWEGARDEKEALMAIKAQYRAVPTGGVTFGALRYMSEDREIREQMERIPVPEISFNFLGQSGTRTDMPLLLGKNTNEMTSALVSSPIERPFKLDFNSVIADGRLTIKIVFNDRLHRRWKIETLALYCANALRTLIKCCSALQAPQYTTADFPWPISNRARLTSSLPSLMDLLIKPEPSPVWIQMCCISAVRGPQ